MRAKSSDPRTGVLYVVATPIGNMQDISFRAVETLGKVDLIAAEDTRHTQKLLMRYGIAKRTTSYHDFNKEGKSTKLVAELRGGMDVALVSDAGTPGISDPAYRLVCQCIENNIGVESIPGATAFVPALVLSGLPTDRFVFEGFLPPKKGRKTRLLDLVDERRTIILYESPHRLLKTLNQLREYLGERRVSVSRELTKKFEETIRGRFSETISFFSDRTPKGEFVIVVEGSGK
jgi:16S rRNA (cytidine1402-2'-O)-methyltransferase